MSKEFKIRTRNKNVFLRVTKGHFATMHSHINYYIDVTTQKTRLSEARAVAKEMVSAYRANTIVDTILCLDGTEVIGACVANELTQDNFVNLNAHQTIYVGSFGNYGQERPRGDRRDQLLRRYCCRYLRDIRDGQRM